MKRRVHSMSRRPRGGSVEVVAPEDLHGDEKSGSRHDKVCSRPSFHSEMPSF